MVREASGWIGSASRRWPGSGWWSSPGSVRSRWPACCSPTSAPTSCGSIGSRRGELDVIPPGQPDPVLRGRRMRAGRPDRPGGPGRVLRLIDRADVLVEGFRPGDAERLGVGPDACCAAQSRADLRPDDRLGTDRTRRDAPPVTTSTTSPSPARCTPSGRRDEPPPVPLNLIGDYGGGSTFLVIGDAGGAAGAGRSGRGQVIDAAMVDGVSALLQPVLVLAIGGPVVRPSGRATCSTAPRRTTPPTPAPTVGSSRSARSRTVSTPSLSPVSGWTPEELPDRRDRAQLASAAGHLRGRVRAPDPGRVGGGVRRHRRLRDAGADLRRGARSPAARGQAAPCAATSAAIWNPRRRRGSPAPPPAAGAHGRADLDDVLRRVVTRR